ncbi:MAG: hypothetical protein QGG40_00400 [Myxococcota bacterium]|jgi:hypothetical protein|nr:hypothetical protein [Myxococcota bacterium]
MIPLPSLTEELSTIQTALDAADHPQRLNWMRGLGKREQKALYALADAPPSRLTLEVEFFHGAPGEVVIHHGQNSLPLFSSFQKRVCLHGGEAPVPQGYNHQTMAWLTGPGHFIVRYDGDDVVFDYTVLPEDRPEAFPPLRDNLAGVSRFVYGNMIDRMRRVSDHCTIGIALREERPTGDLFMLLREDPTPVQEA